MKRIYILFLIYITTTSCIPPEESKKYTFGGYVYDSITNDPVENVEVDPGLGQEKVIFTNKYGYFETTIELGGHYDIYGGKFGFSLWKNGYVLETIIVNFDQTDTVIYLEPSIRYIINGQIVDNTTDLGLYSSLEFSFDTDIKNLRTIDLTTDSDGKYILDFYDHEYYYSMRLGIASAGYVNKEIFIDGTVLPDNWTYEQVGSIDIYKYNFGTIKMLK